LLKKEEKDIKRDTETQRIRRAAEKSGREVRHGRLESYSSVSLSSPL
jgi:hypothetical protein